MIMAPKATSAERTEGSLQHQHSLVAWRLWIVLDPRKAFNPFQHTQADDANEGLSGFYLYR
jgi:hypothetical protein